MSRSIAGLRGELSLTLRSKPLWVAVTLYLVFVYTGWHWATTSSRGITLTSADEVLEFVLRYCTSAAIACGCAVLLSFTQEMEWRTIQRRLSFGTTRRELWSARHSLCIMVPLVFAAATVVMTIALAASHDIPLASLAGSLPLIRIAGFGAALAGYAALSLTIGILSARSVRGLTYFFIYLYIDFVLGDFGPDWAVKLLPLRSAMTMVSTPGVMHRPVDPSIPGVISVFGMMLVLSYVVFSRRDL